MEEKYKWLLDFCSYYGVENVTEIDDSFNLFKSMFIFPISILEKFQ